MNYNQERIRKLEHLLIPTMLHEYLNEPNPITKERYKLILDELDLEHTERVQQQFMEALRGGDTTYLDAIC